MKQCKRCDEEVYSKIRLICEKCISLEERGLKYCSVCKELKEIKTDFHWLSKINNIKTSKCKDCRSKYMKKSYNDLSKEDKLRKYELTKEWRRNNINKWKGIINRYVKKQRIEMQHDDKLKQKFYARYAVARAKKRGVKYPNQCKRCNKDRNILWHWSYRKEHQLDVIPLCYKCFHIIKKYKRERDLLLTWKQREIIEHDGIYD